MYLFIKADGSCSVTHDNLTVLDIVAAKTGVTKILKITKNQAYQVTFVADETNKPEKIFWKPIPQSNILAYQDGRIHD